MITADTITDEQIRELRASTGWMGEQCEADQRIYAWALERGHVQRYAARARCAEILNARADAK